MNHIIRPTLLISLIFIIELTLIANPKIAGLTNKKRINFLEGKSISFYLNHPRIDYSAKAFYKGELVLSNDFKNCSFIDSVLTSNDETRPFYLYLYNTIINLSTNAFDKKLGQNCLLYIEKNPCTFFELLNNSDIEINIVKWTNLVGIELSNQQTYLRFKNAVDGKMAGCSNNKDLWVSFFSEARKSRIR